MNCKTREKRQYTYFVIIIICSYRTAAVIFCFWSIFSAPTVENCLGKFFRIQKLFVLLLYAWAYIMYSYDYHGKTLCTSFIVLQSSWSLLRIWIYYFYSQAFLSRLLMYTYRTFAVPVRTYLCTHSPSARRGLEGVYFSWALFKIPNVYTYAKYTYNIIIGDRIS